MIECSALDNFQKDAKARVKYDEAKRVGSDSRLTDGALAFT